MSLGHKCNFCDNEAVRGVRHSQMTGHVCGAITWQPVGAAVFMCEQHRTKVEPLHFDTDGVQVVFNEVDQEYQRDSSLPTLDQLGL